MISAIGSELVTWHLLGHRMRRAADTLSRFALTRLAGPAQRPDGDRCSNHGRRSLVANGMPPQRLGNDAARDRAVLAAAAVARARECPRLREVQWAKRRDRDIDRRARLFQHTLNVRRRA